MAEQLLQVENLKVNVGDKEILHGINLTVNPGEIHVIMGPNGAGKSTLGNALMGNPNYEMTEGTILFHGKDLAEEPTDVRAKEGLFLSFQNPIEVPGITLANFIRNAIDQRREKKIRLFEFRKLLEAKMKTLSMDEDYADRDLNVGFSGGEKKKAEILQLLMLNPDLAILDETDSGLDVDAVRIVSDGVRAYMEAEGKALIIITHSTRILDALDVDYTHILVNGKIVKTGDASLIKKINEGGFEQYLS